MRAIVVVSVVLALAACEKQLTPTEKAAKDRSECLLIATEQTGFDPITAEEPVRTVSSSHQRGSDAKETVTDVAKGAAGGAVLGVVGGAIAGDVGKGAGAGAAVGGLIGGYRNYKKRGEVVTTTHPNPEYEAFVASKHAYKDALDQCLADRAKEPQ